MIPFSRRFASSWLVIATAVAMVLIPRSSDAQVSVMPVKVCASPVRTPLDATVLDGLTADYNQGDWVALRAKARRIIDAAKAAVGPGCETDSPRTPNRAVATLLDISANYVAVSWVGTDPFGAKAVFMRIVVHEPAAVPFPVDLPGIGVDAGDPQMAEVFVSRSSGAESVTVLTSTREEDPLVAQLPALAQAIAGPLFGTIATQVGTVDNNLRQQRAAQEKLYVTVARVGLPFRRASVRLQASAHDAVDLDQFKKAVHQLPGTLKFKEAAYSECARSYADDLETKIVTAVDAVACGADEANPKECKAQLERLMHDAYVAATAAKPLGCGPTKADLDAMQDVDQKFRTLVATGSSSTATADLTFHNRPLTKWSLGAGGGVIAYGSLNRPRVKLDSDNNLVADPLTRVMTMAFVNWSPGGYDESTPSMQWPERVRWFFGAALTPDFGTVAGANIMLVRGLGIAIGGAFLFGKGANEDEIGKPPAQSSDLYRLATARTVFVGVTYNRK